MSDHPPQLSALQTRVEFSKCPNAPDPHNMAIDVPAAIFAKQPPANDKHVEYDVSYDNQRK